MAMKLVKVLDLVGKPVAGLKADLHTRNADGGFRYSFDHDANRVTTLKSVAVRREKDGHQWLRWEWERNGSGMPFDCGYSAIRLDSDDVHEYYIMIAEVR